MLKIERTRIYGFEDAVRGMRNPMNSWDKSDSCFEDCNQCKFDVDKSCEIVYPDACSSKEGCFVVNDEFPCSLVGKNDLNLMCRLADSGSDHRKYLRMIAVYVDITGPLYWWKEFDTYKVGTVANSCSTMHKIAEKEFTMEDFSCEHLIDDAIYEHDGLDSWEAHIFPVSVLKSTICVLNVCRNKFLETKDKKYWWQMIQLLPSSYNQKRTIMMNYEVIRNMYHARKAHKLDEWRVTFCDWAKSLPYANELIVGGNK